MAQTEPVPIPDAALGRVLKRLLLDDDATVDTWPHDDGSWWFHVDGTVSVTDIEAWLLRNNGADYDPEAGRDDDA